MLESVGEFKVARYKVNTQKLIAFLYTSNLQLETKKKKTTHKILAIYNSSEK